MYISFDEWGVITDTGAVPGGRKQEYGFASFREMDAVIYGGIMCTFMNYADRVKIACQSLLVNEGGMLTTDPAGKVIRQATFYPFQDMARYGHGTALRGVGSYPAAGTGHHGEQETVVTSCAYDAEEGELTVFAVNCGMEDIKLELEFQSFKELEGVEWRMLWNEDPWAKNTFEEEYRVTPEEKEPVRCEQGHADAVLKRHSWNVLRFRESRRS